MGDLTCLQCTVRARPGTGSDVEEMGGGQVNCIRIAGILFLNQNSLICWWLFLGMKVYLSWYERDDEIFTLVNCGWSSIFVADNWYLSFVEGQKSPFCQRKCAKHRWGELFGDFFGWMFSPLPSITADEPFIHLSVRWPPRQKARSKPTKPHTSGFVGGLILPKWPQFKYLGVNDGGKCHGRFSFFPWRASWEYPLGLHPGWTMILFSQK